MEIEHKGIIFEIDYKYHKGEKGILPTLSDPGSPDIPEEIEIEEINLNRPKFISSIIGQPDEEFNKKIILAGEILFGRHDEALKEIILKQLSENRGL